MGEGEDSKGLAMISLYQKPDPVLYEESYQTLWACEYMGSQNLHIVPIEKIASVVSMQPLPALPNEPQGRWFTVEKPGLDNAIITGHEEDMHVL